MYERKDIPIGNNAAQPRRRRRIVREYQTLLGLIAVAASIVIAAYIIRPGHYTAVSNGQGVVVIDTDSGTIKRAY